MPSAPMSVKSDNPIRPGGCSWRKITSRLGPLSARHPATRRSKVRRTPGAIPGLRRQISSKMATARIPGAASSIGTISLSHTPASGSGRRRPRVLLRWQPRIGFNPIGGGSGKPGFRGSDRRDVALTGLHVQPRLAVGGMSARQVLILPVVKNQMLCPTAPTARACLSRWGKRGSSLITVGLRPPSSAYPRRHSHPDCRSPLTLIVAQHDSTGHVADVDPDQAQELLDHIFDHLKRAVDESGGLPRQLFGRRRPRGVRLAKPA
jgi:hypothetical protein